MHDIHLRDDTGRVTGKLFQLQESMVPVEAVREGDNEHDLRASEMEISVQLQNRKTDSHWNQSIIIQLVVTWRMLVLIKNPNSFSQL